MKLYVTNYFVNAGGGQILHYLYCSIVIKIIVLKQMCRASQYNCVNSDIQNKKKMIKR